MNYTGYVFNRAEQDYARISAFADLILTDIIKQM